jgi:hypothetical protein
VDESATGSVNSFVFAQIRICTPVQILIARRSLKASAFGRRR